ncbi:13853_t:CDS:2 [Cetraspora pellucida]|uniref:13853_t:CDS:1 n=1 Tax=Cetraspora pellucida TaxID=1433469 RepID=A0A9N9J9L4_9GLOM|nr:13853_t:CDS:2 [Cetraspora pellucida]
MDNTTTNKAVTRILQDELPNINLISIECICHILNLIVKAGLAEIDRLQQKVHKVIKYLANPLANGHLEFLESYCRVVGEPSMPSCLKTEELLELESFCQILKPFEVATTILFKDQSNSISDALTIILEIEQHINNIRHNSNAVCLMKKKFQKYWAKISNHVLIAHVLDPRYKISHSSVSEIEGDDSMMHDVFFPKRLKKHHINTGSLDYELELYEREPLENFENESDDAKSNRIFS